MNKKIFNIAFTMADRRSSRFHISGVERIGFTMAEILLSLTIIGVVAAITLPSLTGNINEKTWNTQRKAFYARMSQAIALMGSLNGYGLNSDSSQTISNAAKVFITEGLSKTLKINNICDYDHFQDCGLASNVVTITGSKINLPKTLFGNLYNAHANSLASSTNLYNTRFVAFETQNGESVAVYYNPICKTDDFDWSKSVTGEGDTGIGNTIQYMCANFVFDMNGKKGPNTVGKDIGTLSVFYPIDSHIVSPQPNSKFQGNLTYDDAIAKCKSLGDDYRLPTIHEWMGLYLNYKLYDWLDGSSINGMRYWSITPFNYTSKWTMYTLFGTRRNFGKTNRFSVRCIKR